MNTTHLPTLAAVIPHPARSAVLVTGTGRAVTVATADRVIFAPEPGVIIVHGKGYAVPAYLHSDLRAALKLEGAL